MFALGSKLYPLPEHRFSKGFHGDLIFKNFKAPLQYTVFLDLRSQNDFFQICHSKNGL